MIPDLDNELVDDGRQWRHEQPPPPRLEDLLDAAMRREQRRRRQWAPILAVAACVVVVGSAAALIAQRSGPARPGSQTTQGAASATGTPDHRGITGSPAGCGVQTPPNAATVGYDAVLRPAENGHTWRLTLTNDTDTSANLNVAGFDLVALDVDGRIIGAKRNWNADARMESIAPHRSWSGDLTPTATDCSAKLNAGIGPVIPAGTYTFVATILIGEHYLSSNPVSISVSSQGRFSAL